MVEQQGDDVVRVLAVELHHLQLRQEQLCGRQGRGVQLEAVGQRQRVAHAEAADEEVDVPGTGRVVEDHALRAVHGVEALVGLVPGRDQEARGFTAGLARADEIDVGVAARECGMNGPGGVEPDREAAQQAQRQA